MFILDFVWEDTDRTALAKKKKQLPSVVILSQKDLLTVDGTGVSDSTHAALEVSNLLVVITINMSKNEVGGAQSLGWSFRQWPHTPHTFS